MGGAPAGAGGAAARRVAFLRKKLRKNLFGKRFLGYPMGWVRTWRFPRLRGRAQYLPVAKTVLHGAFPYRAHLSLGGMIAKCLGCFQIGIYRCVETTPLRIRRGDSRIARLQIGIYRCVWIEAPNANFARSCRGDHWSPASKLGFIGVLRQIPSESVGAIHELPASKLGFIELLRYGHPAKITYKLVGTGVLDCPRTNG